MADKLRDTLIERAVQKNPPTAPTGLPAVPPSGDSGRVPPAWKRYRTGLEMQNAYANNWQPNPALIRILRGD